MPLCLLIQQLTTLSIRVFTFLAYLSNSSHKTRYYDRRLLHCVATMLNSVPDITNILF